MFEIEYLTDKKGQPKAVVIPIEVSGGVESSGEKIEMSAIALLIILQ